MTDGICPFAKQVVGVTTFNAGNVDRVGFCDHTAGGYFGTLANASFWNGAGTSVHFGISQTGEVCQMVNIFDTAWAQGRDARGQSVGISSPRVTWAPFAEMQHLNPNGYLISTEHEDKQQTNYVWSEAMYQADLRVKRWCVEEVQRVAGRNLMRFGRDSLSGHFMFDPVNRAYCPGDGWPRGRLWDDLGGIPAMPEPTTDDEIKALVALAHFLRNGWNVADLSPSDRAAIKSAAEKVPA